VPGPSAGVLAVGLPRRQVKTFGSLHPRWRRARPPGRFYLISPRAPPWLPGNPVALRRIAARKVDVAELSPTARSAPAQLSSELSAGDVVETFEAPRG